MHFDPSAQANWSEEQESESEEAREPLLALLPLHRWIKPKGKRKPRRMSGAMLGYTLHTYIPSLSLRLHYNTNLKKTWLQIFTNLDLRSDKYLLECDKTRLTVTAVVAEKI